jgi:curved DNA-binding protein CbpA
MAPAPITEDYYMVLEVQQTATPELVNRSYKRLALKLHPDRNNKHDATEAFQLVCQFLTQVNSFVDRQITCAETKH